MNCKLCGRPIKSEKSKKVGYGPTCFKKSGLLKKKGILIKRLSFYEKDNKESTN